MSPTGPTILRVFPRRTKATPTDHMAFVGEPGLFLPPADEVHVSCTFTWDRKEARRLQRAWANHYACVRIGGPAFDDPGGEFVPGRYLAPGYTITSRGCPNHCEKCLVPDREGRIRTLPVRDGWDLLDNNLLACPRDHIEAVLDMLARQPRPARFTGGLEAARLGPWFAARLAGLRFENLYLAYDRPSEWRAVEQAVGIIRSTCKWPDGTCRKKLGCYVLVGFDGDTIAAAERRVQQVAALSVAPFPMYFQPPSDTRRPTPPEWRDLVTRAIKSPQAVAAWTCG